MESAPKKLKPVNKGRGNSRALPKRPPVVLNLTLVSFILLLNIFYLFVIPIWLYPQSSWWALTAIPFVFSTPLQWALIHEAVHKMLHSNRNLSYWLGRVLSWFLFASFEVLQFGHLMHHRFNRKIDAEWYDPKSCSKLHFYTQYYWYLFIGVYISEVFGTFILGSVPERAIRWIAPRAATNHEGKPFRELAQLAEQFFCHPKHLARLRGDTLAIICLLITIFWVGQEGWLFLLLTLLARGFFISFHDNVYHYATPLENTVPAVEMQAPSLLTKWILNFNYHFTHHMHPDVPWVHLPAIHERKRYPFEGSLLKSLMRQVAGPQVLPEESEGEEPK